MGISGALFKAYCPERQ